MTDLTRRSTEEVLEDHLRCRIAADVEGDIERNYSPDVVMLTSNQAWEGHDAVRHFHAILRQHVPDDYEIPVKHIKGLRLHRMAGAGAGP